MPVQNVESGPGSHHFPSWGSPIGLHQKIPLTLELSRTSDGDPLPSPRQNIVERTRLSASHDPACDLSSGAVASKAKSGTYDFGDTQIKGSHWRRSFQLKNDEPAAPDSTSSKDKLPSGHGNGLDGPRCRAQGFKNKITSFKWAALWNLEKTWDDDLRPESGCQRPVARVPYSALEPSWLAVAMLLSLLPGQYHGCRQVRNIPRQWLLKWMLRGPFHGRRPISSHL
jgi:hypothetical protein